MLTSFTRLKKKFNQLEQSLANDDIKVNKTKRISAKQYSQGKTMLYSVQYKNGCLAASDLFIYLHNQLSSIRSIIMLHVLRVQMFEKCDLLNRQ